MQRFLSPICLVLCLALLVTAFALLATDAAIAVIVNFGKIIFFGTLDALTPSLFIMAVVMGLFTIPGTWVAAWIVRRTDIRIHTLFIEALIVVGGASLIYGSLT